MWLWWQSEGGAAFQAGKFLHNQILDFNLPLDQVVWRVLCEQLSEPHHPDPVRLPRLLDVVRRDDDGRAALVRVVVVGHGEEVIPHGRTEERVHTNLIKGQNKGQIKSGAA
jgi:hypothetical protein